MEKKKQYKRNTEGLARYADEKRTATEERINLAIDKMKRNGEKIRFSSVAARAGVSRTTLYGNPRIKERINSLESIASTSGVTFHNKSKTCGVYDRLKELRGQVKKLENEKKKLVGQLVDYYETKKENERLCRRLSQLTDKMEEKKDE